MPAKRQSMFCSRHSCLTDRRVYLKSGTNRTLVMVNLFHLPSLDLAKTGMSPF